MRLTKPYRELAPALFDAQLNLWKQTRAAGLEPRLLELLDLRVSQLNGCAYCIDMHSADLQQQGETPRRLALLTAWRESALFSQREQAALAWAEVLTRLTQHSDTEQPFQALKAHFTEPEIVALTFAVLSINGWNRLGIGFRLDLPE